ncbi:MAG: hypothetical protein HKN63_10120 [Rhodobacteraceae bacterium]|nr:hypothetical protein [Paracoccaceae bacterium]
MSYAPRSEFVSRPDTGTADFARLGAAVLALAHDLDLRWDLPVSDAALDAVRQAGETIESAHASRCCPIALPRPAGQEPAPAQNHAAGLLGLCGGVASTYAATQAAKARRGSHGMQIAGADCPGAANPGFADLRARVAAIGAIARDHPRLKTHISVCHAAKYTSGNCETCGKCVRTKLSLVAASIDLRPCFEAIPDLAELVGGLSVPKPQADRRKHAFLPGAGHTMPTGPGRDALGARIDQLQASTGPHRQDLRTPRAPCPVIPEAARALAGQTGRSCQRCSR